MTRAPGTMKVAVLYFAWLRERLGRDGEAADVVGSATVADLLAQLTAENPGVFDAGAVRAAVNQAVAPMTQALQDGDEVAFFPPMTGG